MVNLTDEGGNGNGAPDESGSRLSSKLSNGKNYVFGLFSKMYKWYKPKKTKRKVKKK